MPNPFSSFTGLLAVALFFFGFAACSEADPVESSPRRVESWSLGPEPHTSIGRVEGEDQYLFERVSAAGILPDGRIVVGDRGSGTIRVYRADGTFETEFGGSGEGPGEFRRLSTLSISPPDTIVAFDSDLYRLTRFLVSGELVSTFQAHASDGMPELYLGTYSTGDLAFGWILQVPRDWSAVSPDMMQYSRFGSDGVLASPLATVPGMRRLRSPLPFSPHPLNGMVGDSVLITDGLLPKIQVLDPNGVEVREILVPSIELDVDAAWEGLRADMEKRDDSMYLEMLSAFPRPDSIPQIARLLVDDQNRLWVKKYDPLVDSHWLGRPGTGGEWQVLEWGGRHLATLRAPDGYLIFGIRGGQVVGLTRDELGVERVLVFDIVGTEGP